MNIKRLLVTLLFTSVLFLKGEAILEAREHSRSNPRLNVKVRYQETRGPRPRMRHRCLIPNQVVYVPRQQIIYRPVYIEQPAPLCLVEEVYIPVQRTRPSFFTGFSFGLNFRL